MLSSFTFSGNEYYQLASQGSKRVFQENLFLTTTQPNDFLMDVGRSAGKGWSQLKVPALSRGNNQKLAAENARQAIQQLLSGEPFNFNTDKCNEIFTAMDKTYNQFWMFPPSQIELGHQREIATGAERQYLFELKKGQLFIKTSVDLVKCWNPKPTNSEDLVLGQISCLYQVIPNKGLCLESVTIEGNGKIPEEDLKAYALGWKEFKALKQKHILSTLAKVTFGILGVGLLIAGSVASAGILPAALGGVLAITGTVAFLIGCFTVGSVLTMAAFKDEIRSAVSSVKKWFFPSEEKRPVVAKAVEVEVGRMRVHSVGSLPEAPDKNNSQLNQDNKGSKVGNSGSNTRRKKNQGSSLGVDQRANATPFLRNMSVPKECDKDSALES